MYYFKLFFGNSEAKSSAHNSLKWPGLGFASFYAGFCAVFASLPWSWWRVTSAFSDLASKSTHDTIWGQRIQVCWSVDQKLKIYIYFQFLLKLFNIEFNLDICPPSPHTQPSAVEQWIQMCWSTWRPTMYHMDWTCIYIYIKLRNTTEYNNMLGVSPTFFKASSKTLVTQNMFCVQFYLLGTFDSPWLKVSDGRADNLTNSSFLFGISVWDISLNFLRKICCLVNLRNKQQWKMSLFSNSFVWFWSVCLKD